MTKLDPPHLIEQLRYTISRYDHYYDTVNNKGAFFVALNSALVGGLLLLQFEYSGKSFTLTPGFECLLMVCLALCLVSIAATLLAIVPYGTSGSRSNLFFGSVAARSTQEYMDDIKKETDDSLINDLAGQAHALSLGLRKKFRLLTVASISLAVNFLATLLLTYNIMHHLIPATT